MELKKYQKRVIDDLNDYLEILTSTQSLSRAYSKYWEARHITVGPKTSHVKEYQNTITDVPNICYKVQGPDRWWQDISGRCIGQTDFRLPAEHCPTCARMARAV